MILVAIGLPALIFYSAFFSGSDSDPRDLESLVELQNELSEIQGSDYLVHQAYGGAELITASIVLDPVPADEDEAHMRSLNVLYDIQSRIGRERDIRIFAGQTEASAQFRPQSLLFYSSVSQRSEFKSFEAR